MSRQEQPFEAVIVERLEGRAPVLFVCEHASCHFPPIFGNLGLDEAVRESHVAWDLGALAVAKLMAREFEAPLVHGAVSRLLYDCNRPPEAPGAVPERSEVYEIPGNRDLPEEDRQRRVDMIYRPFAAALETAIDTASPSAIVTIHSFTPIYFGERRAVEIGVLHDHDRRLADAVLANSVSLGLKVERNKPYGPGDGVMHTLRTHAETRELPNVMIEIRNDLIADGEGQAGIAEGLAKVMRAALADCDVDLREAS